MKLSSRGSYVKPLFEGDNPLTFAGDVEGINDCMSAVSNRQTTPSKKQDTKRDGRDKKGGVTFNKFLIHSKINGFILLVVGIMIHPNGLPHVRGRGPPGRLGHHFPAGGRPHTGGPGQDDDCVVWPCLLLLLLLLLLILVFILITGLAAGLTGWHLVETAQDRDGDEAAFCFDLRRVNTYSRF